MVESFYDRTILPGGANLKLSQVIEKLEIIQARITAFTDKKKKQADRVIRQDPELPVGNALPLWFLGMMY